MTVSHLAQWLAAALAHHQAGNLQQAEQWYRQVLQADPGNANVLHMLGLVAGQLGRHDQAIALIGDAIALNPLVAGFHSSLGLSLRALGRLEDAVAACQQAVHLEPDSADTHASLGSVLKSNGQFEEAVAHYREALVLRPGFALAHGNLGNILLGQHKLDEAIGHLELAAGLQPGSADALTALAKARLEKGDLDEAARCCRQAIQFNPQSAEAQNVLGVIHAVQGRLDDAASCYRRALQLIPDFADAHNNLGAILFYRKDFDAAVNHFQQAVKLSPNIAQHHVNLGGVLYRLGDFQSAVEHLQRADRMRPNHPETLCNLGNALYGQGKLAEAVGYFERSLQLKPDYEEAHWSHAVVWLLQGELERGWEEYEWRWQKPEFGQRPFARPLWDGSDLAGRTILIYAEQGLGDTMQFIRYAPLVKQRGGRVIFECQASLLGLLDGVQGVDQLVAQGSALPDFDVQAPLLSLPRILRTTFATIPATVPYLRASGELVEHWRSRFAGLDHGSESASGNPFRIGIAWQGNPGQAADRWRSIPLARFAPLANVEAVQLVSLQKGPGVDQLAGVAGEFSVLDLGTELDEAAGPFMDTAAVIQNLDLVIASDTAVLHLAGALGMPVWGALTRVPDWRWLLEREDSPWYPTMRLFRQRVQGDWDEVFERMVVELKKLVAQAGNNPKDQQACQP